VVASKTLRFATGLVAVAMSTSSFAREHAEDGHFAVGFGVPDFSYDIDRKPTDADQSVSTLDYAPNIPLTADVEFAIGGVTLGASFDIPGTDNGYTDPTGKTSTTYSSYEFSYFFDRIGLDLNYTTLRGMNLVSATGVDGNTLANDPTAHRSDITLINETADLYLAPLAWNFSLRDFFDPASQSHGCGLALVAVGSYDRLDERADRRIVPTAYSAPYGIDASLMGGNFQSVIMQFGPAFVLDFHGAYLEGLFTYGNGNETAVYRVEPNTQMSESRTADRTTLYAAAGYRGTKMFWSFDYTESSPSYDMHTVTLSTTQDLMSFIVGVRF